MIEKSRFFIGEPSLYPDSSRNIGVCDYESLSSTIGGIDAGPDQHFPVSLSIHGYEFHDEYIAAIHGTMILQQDYCGLMKMEPIFGSHTLPVDELEVPEEIATDIERLREDGVSEGILINLIYR